MLIKIKKLIPTFILGFTILLGLLTFYYYITPKIEYSLLTSKAEEELESPLSYSSGGDTIHFGISFIGRVGEFDKLKFRKKIMFKNSFPFLEFGDELTIQLMDDDDESKQSRVLYALTGYFYNLDKDIYKIRIIDTYDNLIDEKTVKLYDEEAVWRTCEQNEDCVPVTCDCDCSGCGGFSHQDVVNKEYANDWYRKANCISSVEESGDENTECAQVCCSPKKIVCENNICIVLELEETDENSDTRDENVETQSMETSADNDL